MGNSGSIPKSVASVVTESTDILKLSSDLWETKYFLGLSQPPMPSTMVFPFFIFISNGLRMGNIANQGHPPKAGITLRCAALKAEAISILLRCKLVLGFHLAHSTHPSQL
ncbi:hypothetical protein TNCV_3083501 [Trichonephila clavipes]|nr:hypothetical protein TNCV_3083501 [Trichonephila clavipes]